MLYVMPITKIANLYAHFLISNKHTIILKLSVGTLTI